MLLKMVEVFLVYMRAPCKIYSTVHSNACNSGCDGFAITFGQSDLRAKKELYSLNLWKFLAIDREYPFVTP